MTRPPDTVPAAIATLRRLIATSGVERRRDGSRPHPEDDASAHIESAVGPHNIPESIRAMSSLPGIDYVDVFTCRTGGDADTAPEQWARAMFGDTPDAAERFIWRGLLGLRLSRGRSPHTVAGWRIAARGEDWIRLEATSWFLTGNLVVQATDGRVSLGTFLHYDRPLGRLVWPPLSAFHRRLTPGVLRDAVAAVRAR